MNCTPEDPEYIRVGAASTQKWGKCWGTIGTGNSTPVRLKSAESDNQASDADKVLSGIKPKIILTQIEVCGKTWWSSPEILEWQA